MAGADRAPHHPLGEVCIAADRNRSSAALSTVQRRRVGYVLFRARNARTIAATSGDWWPHKDDSVQRVGKKMSPVCWISRSISSARRHEPDRVRGSQRMVEVLQRFEHPRLAAAVLEGAEARRRRARVRRGRPRAPASRTRTAPCDPGSRSARAARPGSSASRAPRGRPARTPSRSRPARPASGPAPAPRGATPARATPVPSAEATTSRNALNHAAFWLCVDARARPGAQCRLEGGARARLAAAASGSASRPARRNSARAARSARRSHAPARARAASKSASGATRRSSMLSQSVTHALPRVSGSATSSM